MSRAEAKVARRAHRLAASGLARRHWERRRKGTRNSAPQLKHRGKTSLPENILLDGGTQGVKKGYQPTAEQVRRYRAAA